MSCKIKQTIWVWLCEIIAFKTETYFLFKSNNFILHEKYTPENLVINKIIFQILLFKDILL